MATEPNIIISSEAFGSIRMTSDHVANLRDALPDFDVTVVVYVRRQDDYILSCYQQDVKGGSKSPFLLNDRIQNPQNFFSRRIDIWKTVFGDDKVIVRPFDPNQWHQGDLFVDFMFSIGGPTEGLQLSRPANEGLDYRQISVLRHANAHLAESQDKARPARSGKRSSRRSIVQRTSHGKRKTSDFPKYSEQRLRKSSNQTIGLCSG